MNDQLAVLGDVVDRLKTLGIGYMVSGSFALIYYAEPRMTRDIDIVVELKPSGAARFLQAFDGDFLIPEAAFERAVRERRMFNIIHVARAVKVDFVVRGESAYRRLEFSRRRSVSFAELEEISIVSPEDLVLSKLVWAKRGDSDLQKRDIGNLLESVRDLDFDYLRQWAKELSVHKLLDELSHE